MEPIHVTSRYIAWLNDPLTVAQTEQSGLRHSLASVKDYVESTLNAPNALIWRILFAGSHVGNLRLSNIHMTHRRASIGLILGEAHARGHGLGPRAIRLAARYGFESLELHKLIAGLYATNTASQRAFEKAGFRVEAVLRCHAWHEQRFVDVIQMAQFSADLANGPE